MEETEEQRRQREQILLEDQRRVNAAAQALHQLGFQQWPTAVNNQNVNIQSNFGTLQEYREGEDWSLYQERMEQYFIANYVQEDRKVSVLLTLIGENVYKTVRDLCDPDLPKNKTFEGLCEILTKQFSPKITVFKERKEFYDLRQMENEPINSWYARIKSKAVKCEFGNLLEEHLREKFITGLKPGKILDRMCEELHTK